MPLPRYRPRRLVLRHGRSATLRAIRQSDAAGIVQAFDRLSKASRYSRFMQHKKQLDPNALAQGVHPRPGREFAFVATVPADGGFDIVGAARYVPASAGDTVACEFAITVADDWHGCGLATELLSCLVRRARHDGYQRIEGLVLADNRPMLALARKLKFTVRPVPDGINVVSVQRALRTAGRLAPAAAAPGHKAASNS